MTPDDLIRVRHMIEAGQTALRFISGRKRADLDDDEMLRFALARVIEIIGEAASRVSTDGRFGTPAIPWADAISMRNRLVHAYFDINATILWKTATEDIPELLPLLEPLLLEHDS